ncbi:unnamed protein product, partial [Effrenium voratum]
KGEHFAVTGEPDAGYYVGNIAGVPRLGLPALKMQDAGQGFRATEPKTGGTTTAFPCMLALASTWDEELVELVAAAIATEFKGKGANVVLGPSINVHRVAAGGRNFEYLSGEDGHLGARLTAAYVKGVQDQGVMAVAKHFAFNEQETKRMLMDAHASERSKWELYYAPFRAAVEAGVGAVMCAYNKVNGTYACHNSEILTNDLRSKMGFHGFVMSDWLAMHSPEALAAGLDQEQPGLINLPFGNKYGILSDKVITGLDRKVKEGAARHILTSVFRLGLDLEPGCAPPNCTKELTSDQTKAITKGQSHGAIAFRAAASAVTLLKNTNSLLPLSKGKVHRIAVVGKACHDAAHASYIGKGSGFVQPDSSARTPFQAIKERASKDEIEVVKPEGDTAAEAAALASSADLVIVVIGADASEGADRSSLDLGLDNDALVRGVTSKAPTVVLLQIPGAALLVASLESVGAVDCSPGSGFLPGTAFCAKCPKGTFGGGNLCTRCPAGRWSNQEGASEQDVCKLCSAGKWGSQVGAISEDACMACPHGRWGAQQGAAAVEQCTACPAGRWSDLLGSSSNSSCRACLPGRYGPDVGQLSQDACHRCPAGRWRSTPGGASAESCQKCPAGTWSDVQGATVRGPSRARG